MGICTVLPRKDRNNKKSAIIPGIPNSSKARGIPTIYKNKSKGKMKRNIRKNAGVR
jgi:hypothetical protein